ncbi:pilus assembly protein TadG-related protein [Caulobacter sp. BK020]|uniref:pilus assembly protein TadG-related protein n=1 Tax=Caulobacter sp. BK020 TaxID=2512117 RepID=UPI0010E2B71A|nr:pilus assembly protein TadG-related protein [Caulobacter sp. BK020]TCS16532.1 putative membrane protein [Caulobacter sp. BK020]
MRGLRGADFRRDRRGGVAVITAMSLTLILALAGLAVDMGWVYLQSRRLQGVADLAAITAANDIGRAQIAAQATVTANGDGWRTPPQTTVTLGRYIGDAAIPVKTRFQATAQDPDAVKVSVASEAELFFGAALLGRPSVPMRREATAARADLASFSIGSRLASLKGGLANVLLGDLTGSQVNLSVMDYDALADADVSLFGYLDAVSTRLNLKGPTYDQVLQADLTTGQALQALADVLSASGESQAASATRTLALSAGDRTPAHLDALASLGPYGDQDHVAGGSAATVALSAMDLAQAVLQAGNGDRQLKLDLGATVPGLADTDVWLAIGEPMNNAPYMTVTQDKTVVVHTSQARLYIDAKLAGSGLLGGLAQVHLPVLVELASGEARLKEIDCGHKAATLEVKPSIGSLKIGDIDLTALNDFKRPLAVTPAKLVKAPLFDVSGKSDVALGGASWQTVSFTAAEVKAGAVKTVKTNDTLAAATASLLTNLDLDVDFASLIHVGLDDAAILAALKPLLAAAATPLDGVITSLTDLLGLGVGEADVRVNGLRCGVAALVA